LDTVYTQCFSAATVSQSIIESRQAQLISASFSHQQSLCASGTAISPKISQKSAGRLVSDLYLWEVLE
jgi:hypothetical protein